MIISPPFLPPTGQPEDAWLDVAMAQPMSLVTCTLAPEGSFPLSRGLAWHNGIHIQSPQVDGAYLPVRAVADGEIVFLHPPTTATTDASHALNYDAFRENGPSGTWTSDGFVVIRHKTEIGAAGTLPTEVCYYSAYMHLSTVAMCPKTKAAWKVGDAIYRKDELGAPGHIYGHGGQIHFEVCCDRSNLKKIVGREPIWTDTLLPTAPTADGRTDSVFGSIYIYLPAHTPTSAAKPTQHLRMPSSQTLGAAQWIQITYDKGCATTASYDTLGEPIGTSNVEANFEYEMYAKAIERDKSVQASASGAAGVSNAGTPPVGSPSDWYELLRFGRNLAGSALSNVAAHWRLVPTASGVVWADLNASGTFKFSDADFPPVMGWNFYDDDTSPGDQRCDSLNMKLLIRDRDPNNAHRMEAAQLMKRLANIQVRSKLRRTVCKFPSEWNQDTVEARHGFLKPGPSATPTQQGAWTNFVTHAKALTFANLPQEFLAADWRFHPREFVELMRKCGWLAKSELAQIYPDRFYNKIETPDPAARREEFRTHLNRLMQKHLIRTPTRKSHFLGQIAIESFFLARMMETSVIPSKAPHHPSVQSENLGYYSSPADSYFSNYDFFLGNVTAGDGQKFRGRGIKQLTGLSNYARYWIYRGWIAQSSFSAVWWQPSAAHTSQYKDPTKTPPNILTPQLISTDPFNCVDAGAWYWEAGSAQSHFRTINEFINEHDITDSKIKQITAFINGGKNALPEGAIQTKRIAEVLMDQI